MPQLPSDRDLGLVPADASSSIARAPGAGQVGEAMAQTGANVVQFGSTILDVHDENAQAAADAAIWRGKVALDQKYKNDPDPATAPQRYNDELSALVSSNAGNIIQPRVKTQFLDMANRYVVARGVEMIQNQSDARLQNQAVAKLLADTDASVNAFAGAPDERTQFGVLQSTKAQWDAAVKAGMVDATQAYKYYNDFVERATYAHIVSGGTPDEIQRRVNEFKGIQAPAAPQSTAAPGAIGNIDDIAATMRGKEGGPGGYTATGGGAYQVHGGPVNENSTPAEQDAFFKQEFPARMQQLAAALGRPVTPADGALAWQQGVGGATALLKNPTQNAVATLVAAGVPEQTAVSSIVDNGGSRFETAAAFIDHVKGYYGLPDTATAAANTNTPVTKFDLDTPPAPGSMASRLPADKYDTMMQGIAQQLNVAQSKLDHQAVVDRQIQEANAKDAMVGYQRVMEAHALDPQHSPDIDWTAVNNDPRLAHDPTALPALLSYQKNLDHPNNDAALDKKTTAQLYRGLIDGTKTTKDVNDAFAPPDQSPGLISNANREMLLKVANDNSTQDGKNFNDMKKAFLDRELPQITHFMGMNIGGDDDAYRFQWDLEKAIEAKKKAGENPATLLDPTSKDFFASPGNMKNYVKPFSVRLGEMTAAQKGAPAPLAPGAVPPDLPAGTVYVGKLKDGRDAYRQPDGTLKAVTAPAPPAEALPPSIASDETP